MINLLKDLTGVIWRIIDGWSQAVIDWIRRRTPAPQPPPAVCPITWRPSALTPVFYGIRDYAAGISGAPTACRVFFPSLDGAPATAPLLDGCGKYPLIVFVHGQCATNSDHYKLWQLSPAGLARSGYVVVVPDVPDISAGGYPWDSPSAALQTVTDVLTWMRNGWPHASCLRPPPHTGVVGHSYGGLVGARLAADPSAAVSAYASLSAVWHAWPQSPASPLTALTMPKLLIRGTGISEVSTGYSWAQVSMPKHSVSFDNAEHWDYVAAGQAPCENDRGPCGLVKVRTMDLLVTFFGKYLPPEHAPQLGASIPSSLIANPLSLNTEQQFFAGGHLTSMSSSTSGCAFTTRWERPGDSNTLTRS
jgi:pimeloyl-ACP methyl ester carboxylesterase